MTPREPASEHRRRVLAVRRADQVQALEDEHRQKLARLLSDQPVSDETEADRMDFGYFSYTPPPPRSFIERIRRLFVHQEPDNAD